jgi:hypothetical protein
LAAKNNPNALKELYEKYEALKRLYDKAKVSQPQQIENEENVQKIKLL